MYNGTIKIKEVSVPIPIAVKISAFTYTDRLPVIENTRNMMASCQFDSIPHFAFNLFISLSYLRCKFKEHLPKISILRFICDLQGNDAFRLKYIRNNRNYYHLKTHAKWKSVESLFQRWVKYKIEI